MSTKSLIAKKTTKGYKAIYCHWDGYPEHVGLILKKHYKQPSKVQKLIKLGDISDLRKDIGRKHPFSERDAKSYNNMTTAYRRDRGDKGTGAKLYKSLFQLRTGCIRSGGEWLYIYEKGKWRHEKI